MNFLKGLLLTILSLLLFLSLSVFGLAFTLNSTLLNPDFVVREVEKLDVADIAGEYLADQLSINLPAESGFLEEALKDGIKDVVSAEEPWLKEQAGIVIYAGYDYLLGKSDSFAVSIPLEALKESLRASLWESFQEHLPELLPGLLETEIKPQIDRNYEAFIAQIPRGYLPPGFETLPEEIVKPMLDRYFEDLVRNVQTSGIPPELIPVVEGMLKPYFDEYFDNYADVIPSEITIDKSMIPSDVMLQIEMVRGYLRDFQLGYWLLLGFMVLLVLAIILIHRNVKGPTRELGITLLVYGALEFATVFLARTYVPANLPLPSGLPSSLETWFLGLSADLLAPLQVFSIGVLAGGVALLIISFVYPRRGVEED
jgi:hypothetical protein